VEGARDDFRKARRIVHLRGPLGQRPEGGAVVELLEGLALADAPRDLPDEHDHRRRILPGDVNAGRGVGGAGAAGDEADARAAGELAVGLRHHGGAAFLAADGDRDGRVVQRVERRKIALARNAEDVVDPVDEKLIDENLAAGAGGRCHGRLAMVTNISKERRRTRWPSACIL
jgi:hypothetical protein